MQQMSHADSVPTEMDKKYNSASTVMACEIVFGSHDKGYNLFLLLFINSILRQGQYWISSFQMNQHSPKFQIIVLDF